MNMLLLEMKYMLRTSIFIILLSQIGLVRSQTCCSAGAPISSAIDVMTGDPKALSLQLYYEYKSVNRLVSDNLVLKNDPRSRSGSSLLFKGDYTLSDRWAIGLILPMVSQRRKTVSQTEDATGLGDLTLLSQYSALSDELWQLNLTAGVKIPTGMDLHRDDNEIVLSPDMQSGSGTYDLLFGMGLVKRDLLMPRLTNQTVFSYRHNTTNNHFGDPSKMKGRVFKFGNEAQIATSLSYLLVFEKWFLIPDLGARFRTVKANEEQGLAAPNSGGNWTSLLLGVGIYPSDRYGLRLFSEIPLSQSLFGLQITTDVILGVHLSTNFAMGKPKNRENRFLDSKTSMQ